MSRTSTTALLTAFLLAGSAFGQASTRPQAVALGSPIPMEVGPIQGAMRTQPLGSIDSVGEGIWWGNLDYLLGTIRADRLPPLVTTSPANSSRARAGVLGQSGTSVLFGDRAANNWDRSGLRGNGGYWFDTDRQFGVEGGFLSFFGSRDNFAASSDGTTILARPFTNATTGNQASALIGFPGLSSGSIGVKNGDRWFYTGTIDLRSNIYDKSWMRVDALLGYRYLQFGDRVDIQQTLQPSTGPTQAGTTIQTSDRFRARNAFNGVDVGLRADFVYENFSLELLTKMTGGYLARDVDITGSQTVSAPGLAPVTKAGGLLALSSNIGSRSDPILTIVPEVGATLGYQVNSNLRLRVGYTTLVVPNVSRAVNQIDLGINPGLIPPGTAAAGSVARPVALNNNSDLWLQTLSIGLEVSY